MKKVQPMQNTKRKLVLNERQLELQEFSKDKRRKKEEWQEHRQMKRYESIDG